MDNFTDDAIGFILNSGFRLHPNRIRDISAEVLDSKGRLLVRSAGYWATTTAEERALFGHRYGIYSFPTIELVDRLREIIDGRSAIEIGAGHGVLAEELGIPATDSRMQEIEVYRRIFAETGQPIVRYGPNILEYHATQAVRKFKPKVVIGCWVTHKYDPKRHWAGGSEVGVDEEDILAHCSTYIVVGNEKVHEHKKIWKRRHQIEYPDYVYSRARNGAREFIATWRGNGRPRRGNRSGRR